MTRWPWRDKEKQTKDLCKINPQKRAPTIKNMKEGTEIRRQSWGEQSKTMSSITQHFHKIIEGWSNSAMNSPTSSSIWRQITSTNSTQKISSWKSWNRSLEKSIKARLQTWEKRWLRFGFKIASFPWKFNTMQNNLKISYNLKINTKNNFYKLSEISNCKWSQWAIKFQNFRIKTNTRRNKPSDKKLQCSSKL